MKWDVKINTFNPNNSIFLTFPTATDTSTILLFSIIIGAILGVTCIVVITQKRTDSNKKTPKYNKGKKAPKY